MMMRRYNLFLLILGLSCGNGPEVNSTPPDAEIPEQKSPAMAQSSYFDVSNTTFPAFHTVSFNHYLSNLKEQDRFQIFIPSGNINNTTSHLLILSARGDSILFESFTTRDLINGYLLDRIRTDEGVLQHIKTRVRENLSDASFIDIENSVDGVISEATASDFENYHAFEECKAKKLPVFVFSLGTENITYYGFSSEKNKVIPLIYCC